MTQKCECYKKFATSDVVNVELDNGDSIWFVRADRMEKLKKMALPIYDREKGRYAAVLSETERRAYALSQFILDK